MPDDLKNYRAPRLFDFVSEEPALVFIAMLIAGLILDWAQR